MRCSPGLSILLLSLAVHAAAPDTPEARLSALGHTLPAVTMPIGSFIPAVRTGNLLFLSGQIPRDAAGKVITGKVGRDATEAQAHAAAQRATLSLLATLKQELGSLSKVKRIVRVSGFVNAVDDFKAQPQVINGCSDLLVAVFGEPGRHARVALGMASLPMGALVEIEMVVEVE